MSIIRWGENGSNVYIIGSNGWECVGCKGLNNWVGFDDGDYCTEEKLQLFLEHLKWHRDKGDCVPDWVEAELRRWNVPLKDGEVPPKTGLRV